MHLPTAMPYPYVLGMVSVVAGIPKGSLNEVLVGTMLWLGSLATILIKDLTKPYS